MQLIEQLYQFLVDASPVFELIGFIALVTSLLFWKFSSQGRLFIARILRRISKRFDKSVIGAQCAAFMKPRIEELNQENTEALLPIVKLEFTKSVPDSVRVNADNQVLIVLKESNHKAENLLRIAESYVSKGIMPHGRRLITRAIQRAVEVTIMHRLLSGVDESLRLWADKHFQPCISNEKTKDALEKVGQMDTTGGYLTRMFLPQLELVARRLGIGISPHIVDEANEWMTLVYNISLKHHEDKSVYSKEMGELEFYQSSFGVEIVLVAKSYVIAKYDIKPHVARVVRGLNDPEISEVYIIGWTEKSCFHTLRILGETYMDRRIAEAWCSYYKTTSRGDINVPVVFVRYIKGSIIDESRKRIDVRNFTKNTRKTLKSKLVTDQRVAEWFESNHNQYLSGKETLTAKEYSRISRIMNNEDVTLDVLPYLFENEEINLRYQDLLDSYQVVNLSTMDEVLYRLYAAMGREDDEIVAMLNPKIFLGNLKKERR